MVRGGVWPERGLTCLAVPHEEVYHVPTSKGPESTQRLFGRYLFLIQSPWSHNQIGGHECGSVHSLPRSAPPACCLRLQQDDASSAEGAWIRSTKSRRQETAACLSTGWPVPRCQATTQSRSWVTRAEPVTTRMAAWDVPSRGLGMYLSPHEGGTDTRVSETGGYLSFILLHKAPRRPSSVLSSFCPGVRAGTALSFPVGPWGCILQAPAPTDHDGLLMSLLVAFQGPCHGGKGLP